VIKSTLIKKMMHGWHMVERLNPYNFGSVIPMGEGAFEVHEQIVGKN
jgi:hypothetical protein